MHYFLDHPALSVSAGCSSCHVNLDKIAEFSLLYRTEKKSNHKKSAHKVAQDHLPQNPGRAQDAHKNSLAKSVVHGYRRTGSPKKPFFYRRTRSAHKTPHKTFARSHKTLGQSAHKTPHKTFAQASHKTFENTGA